MNSDPSLVVEFRLATEAVSDRKYPVLVVDGDEHRRIFVCRRFAPTTRGITHRDRVQLRARHVELGEQQRGQGRTITLLLSAEEDESISLHSK